MAIYQPGTMIGNYEVVSKPMMGGMGVVYFAIDHGNNRRPVALKTFRLELLPDRVSRERFLREGTAWIELGNHLNIVRCYKVEYVAPTTFLVLELIAKEQNMPDASLRSWLLPGRPLSLEQALFFALQIARGMQYATEKIPGFVHRDLKPENILVGADKLLGTNINRLRITDFGLVKVIADKGVSTPKRDIKELKPTRIQFSYGGGTPLYMAPEQWNGEQVGIFTDVYAFGLILFEMLSGRPAAEGKTIPELLESHCHSRLRRVPSDVPEDVAALIAKYIARTPADRGGEWTGIIDDLEQVMFTYSRKAVPWVTEVADQDREERTQLVWSYNAIGAAYIDIGKAKTAVDYAEKALVTAREIGDPMGEGNALMILGSSYLHLGKVQQTISYIEQALAIIHDVGDRRAESCALGNLGIAYRELGDVHRGIKFHQRHFEISSEINDPRGKSVALGNLGNAYATLGEVRQAFMCYEQALVIIREIGDWREEAKLLGNIGNLYADLGDGRRAIEYFMQYLKIARDLSDLEGEATALNNVGTVYSDQGNARESIKYKKQALAMAQETGSRKLEGAILANLGSAYHEIGDVRQSIDYTEQALRIARETDDRIGEGLCLGNLGSSYREMGDLQQALAYSKQALPILRETGNRKAECEELNLQGRTYNRLHDVENALKYWQEALQIAIEIGDKMIEGNCSYNIAKAFAHRGDHEQALNLAERALILYQQIGHYEWAKDVQQLIRQIRQETHSNRNSDIASQLESAFTAFQYAASQREMEHAVSKYPIMVDSQFMQTIQEIIAERVLPEHRSAFEERLSWLKQIAGKPASGFLDRLIGKK